MTEYSVETTLLTTEPLFTLNNSTKLASAVEVSESLARVNSILNL